MFACESDERDVVRDRSRHFAASRFESDDAPLVRVESRSRNPDPPRTKFDVPSCRGAFVARIPRTRDVRHEPDPFSTSFWTGRSRRLRTGKNRSIHRCAALPNVNEIRTFALPWSTRQRCADTLTGGNSTVTESSIRSTNHESNATARRVPARIATIPRTRPRKSMMSPKERASGNTARLSFDDVGRGTTLAVFEIFKGLRGTALSANYRLRK